MRLVFVAIMVVFMKASCAQLAGFTLTGNPQSATGATWTFQDTVNNVWYDLQGILFEPQTGTPPYPAVIINHGTGGNINGYSKTVAMKMVQWEFVCIATNLCHSGGVPIGSPGDTSFANFGASANNYLRDMKCWDILASLNYTDTNCIMAFGHSRGAFTTTGLVANYPGKFSCAGHTAGGATAQTGFSAPSTTLAAQATCPYIIHHGDSDSVVPLVMDSVLNSVFDSTGITHQFYIYPGLNHPQMSMDSLMFARTQSWFVNHSCLAASVAETDNFEKEILIFPNPAANELVVSSRYSQWEFGDKSELIIYNMLGEKIFSQQLTAFSTQPFVIDVSKLVAGIYFIVLKDNPAKNEAGNKNVVTRKLVKM